MGEDIKTVLDKIDSGLDEIHDLFQAIRENWEDPRFECRRGMQLSIELAESLRRKLRCECGAERIVKVACRTCDNDE